MSDKLKKVELAKDWANFPEGKTIYVDQQRYEFLAENGFVRGAGKPISLRHQKTLGPKLKVMDEEEPVEKGIKEDS